MIERTWTVASVSVVIPTYNERDNIEEILRNVAGALEGKDYEIIVVDDDSPDRTWELGEQLAAEIKGVRIVRRTGVVRDHAQSVMQGFNMAGGAIIGAMDADGSHDIEVLPRLVEEVEKGADCAVGSRYVKGGQVSEWPIGRQVLSRGATWVVRRVLGLQMKDPLSGFYMMRREVYERAVKTASPQGFKVLLELCVRGHPQKVVEIPIRFKNRVRGESKLRADVVLHGASSVLYLAWFRARETVGMAGGAR
jgi:dolichol-phosphate mannosyltransferase